MTRKPFHQAPLQAHLFQEHVELLRLFLTHREEIVESIHAVLNASRKPIQYLQDRPLLSRLFEDCFFTHSAIAANQSGLRGQLEEAHWATGFKPRQLPGLHSDLIHPAEMMIRGFHFWQQTRWPGRNGRIHYAHALFNVYILRCLQFLSMRIWDKELGEKSTGDRGDAGDRLADVQGVLDGLWSGSPVDQPAIVRDARWLIPLAQSLPTDDLAAYLQIARQLIDTLPEVDALEIQKAQVRMLGGHLTSQIRHHCMKEGVSIDEHSVVLRTRTSNALDFALLIQGLVALLKSYDRALETGDTRMRLELAGAICQGLSPDPELFLNRIDLLSAYSMIEHVFIGPLEEGDDEGNVVYSPLGQRHVRLMKEYNSLVDRLTKPLREDLPRFRPVDVGCSPYGIVFGYPSNLTELMALKTLQRDAETRFSLEDAFTDGIHHDVRDNELASSSQLAQDKLASAKLAWVDRLRKMPHIDPGIQRQYDYPQQFAEDIYDRVAETLDRRDADVDAELRQRDPEAEALGSHRTGRLYIVSGDADKNSKASSIPELPARYFGSTDRQILAAHKAEPYDRTQLLHERQEGHYLVSYEVDKTRTETTGGWIALKKDLLTEVLGAGRDARIAGLPQDAVHVLRLMCTDLVIAEDVPD